jgi:hypothetical protein
MLLKDYDRKRSDAKETPLVLILKGLGAKIGGKRPVVKKL